MVLDLDGGPKLDISTPVPFFTHMLELMAFHAGMNLGLVATGDSEIDDHHTVEDIGILFGQALKETLFAEQSIERYGQSLLPMDEALVLVAVDISGRSRLSYDVDFKRDKLGDLSTENVLEFFHALVSQAGITLHIKKISGDNDHHVCEAIFKGFGRSLREAMQTTGGKGPKSTKGKIG